MSFLKALAVFLGTIIGVGIFGLPFVALKAGFFVVACYFLFMILIAITVNLLYGKVILGTREIHRLPGYVGKYLGERWKKFSFVVIVVSLAGALLAYLIIGGQFLASLFGGKALLYTLLFFGLGSFLVFQGIKSIAEVELTLFFIFLIILTVFFFKAFPVINIDYFKTQNLHPVKFAPQLFNRVKFLFFPYGVVLFSLWGTAVIPEIKEIVRKENCLKKVIFWGIILAAFVYLLFIFVVLGASGGATSKEALSGLGQVVGSNIIKFGFIFGVITCFTSFLTLALTLKKIFWYDFGIPKNLAWLITCFLPLSLFLLGLREFIDVISFTGAVALGLEGIIIVFLYQAFSKKGFNPFYYLLMGIFILGIILEIIYFYVKII